MSQHQELWSCGACCALEDAQTCAETTGYLRSGMSLSFFYASSFFPVKMDALLTLPFFFSAPNCLLVQSIIFEQSRQPRLHILFFFFFKSSFLNTTRGRGRERLRETQINSEGVDGYMRRKKKEQWGDSVTDE